MRVTELRFHCPDIKTMEDAEVIRETLLDAPGISEAEVDYHTGRVRIVTTNQDGGQDVYARLQNSGFPPVEGLTDQDPSQAS